MLDDFLKIEARKPFFLAAVGGGAVAILSFSLMSWRSCSALKLINAGSSKFLSAKPGTSSSTTPGNDASVEVESCRTWTTSA